MTKQNPTTCLIHKFEKRRTPRGQLYCTKCRVERNKLWRSQADESKITKHPLYILWDSIIQKCTNDNDKRFAKYGEKGRTVCDRWKISTNFISDVVNEIGLKPTKEHSLDRINNNGHYEPGNVRWATRKEQQRNRNDTSWVVFEGREQTLAEACEKLNMFPSTAWYRFVTGKIKGEVLINDGENKLTLKELSERTGINLAVIKFRAKNTKSMERITTRYREVPTYFHKGNFYTVLELSLLYRVDKFLLNHYLFTEKMNVADALREIKNKFS